ncbi:SRPBCC family protein [Hyphomicrobium sp. 99]|uniref:SRPBCC family protein n=1 Tax=Hyphomicrobium sp. 99 TaxID=1163419 RepID=UPI0005F895D6|nr:SRPBCC family protein [Hyphomicrobium sp. 99]
MDARNRSDASEADREIITTRVFDAPRELVFEAFRDPHHISNWWGPNGFTTTTYEMDVRPGGQWLYTMHGPDGTDYPNRVRYTEVKDPELLAYDHDAGAERPDFEPFKVWITFETENRKTRVTLRHLFATRERRDEMVKFGAVEGGQQTLARLDLYLTQKEGATS